MSSQCKICGVSLVEGNPENKYGTREGKKYISRHHLLPRRFKKDYFNDDREIKDIFGIDNGSIMLNFCYACHEEVLHNIVFNEAMVEKLSILLKDKSTKEKIVIIHEIIKVGLT